MACPETASPSGPFRASDGLPLSQTLEVSAVTAAVVLPAVARQVVVSGVVARNLVLAAVPGQVVVARFVVRRVVGPPALRRVSPTVVTRAVVDAAQAGQRDPPLQRLELQT